jgi:hypothetical protein
MTNEEILQNLNLEKKSKVNTFIPKKIVILKNIIIIEKFRFY